MGILDIFSFKKDAQKVFTKENVGKILGVARAEIINQIKRNVPGPEKMAVVNGQVTAHLAELSVGINNNLVKWLIGLLLGAVPTITQAVYDFLKEKISRL